MDNPSCFWTRKKTEKHGFFVFFVFFRVFLVFYFFAFTEKSHFLGVSVFKSTLFFEQNVNFDLFFPDQNVMEFSFCAILDR